MIQTCNLVSCYAVSGLSNQLNDCSYTRFDHKHRKRIKQLTMIGLET